jgi:hypothetical protein
MHFAPAANKSLKDAKQSKDKETRYEAHLNLAPAANKWVVQTTMTT